MSRYKQVKFRRNLFGVLHYLALFGPLVGFILHGISNGDVVEKLSLTMVSMIAIILAVFSTFLQAYKAGLHRTILWSLIITITYCINSVETFIVILAVSSLLDELIFTRAFKRYCELTRTNREIIKNGIQTQ